MGIGGGIGSLGHLQLTYFTLVCSSDKKSVTWTRYKDANCTKLSNLLVPDNIPVKPCYASNTRECFPPITFTANKCTRYDATLRAAFTQWYSPCMATTHCKDNGKNTYGCKQYVKQLVDNTVARNVEYGATTGQTISTNMPFTQTFLSSAIKYTYYTSYMYYQAFQMCMAASINGPSQTKAQRAANVKRSMNRITCWINCGADDKCEPRVGAWLTTIAYRLIKPLIIGSGGARTTMPPSLKPSAGLVSRNGFIRQVGGNMKGITAWMSWVNATANCGAVSQTASTGGRVVPPKLANPSGSSQSAANTGSTGNTTSKSQNSGNKTIIWVAIAAGGVLVLALALYFGGCCSERDDQRSDYDLGQTNYNRFD